MPTYITRTGSIEVDHLHCWHDRSDNMTLSKIPLLSSSSHILTIGSCFAVELANAIRRLNLRGKIHPAGTFYSTKTISQELRRSFNKWPEYYTEPIWRVKEGFAHPFKDPKTFFSSLEELRAWSDSVDEEADRLLRAADIIVLTFGLTEVWQNSSTGAYFRQFPCDQDMQADFAFKQLTVQEMLDDLDVIYRLISRYTNASIILTVSPVPLGATFTNQHVCIANIESKSRIRAAVSEFVSTHHDVHYFHSYELVSTAERLSDFMREDGRHLHRHAADYIIHEFLRKFGDATVPKTRVDTSWITLPTKCMESDLMLAQARQSSRQKD